jgi:hypothetical protein
MLEHREPSLSKEREGEREGEGEGEGKETVEENKKETFS